jgi:hypothetical protein
MIRTFLFIEVLKVETCLAYIVFLLDSIFFFFIFMTYLIKVYIQFFDECIHLINASSLFANR